MINLSPLLPPSSHPPPTLLPPSSHPPPALLPPSSCPPPTLLLPSSCPPPTLLLPSSHPPPALLPPSPLQCAGQQLFSPRLHHPRRPPHLPPHAVSVAQTFPTPTFSTSASDHHSIIFTPCLPSFRVSICSFCFLQRLPTLSPSPSFPFHPHQVEHACDTEHVRCGGRSVSAYLPHCPHGHAKPVS
ncbi:unnamed protein product [Closterium sp. NIES-54]